MPNETICLWGTAYKSSWIYPLALKKNFENGMKPIATFPRSLSNLERRSEPSKSAETGRVCKKDQTCYHSQLSYY